eukprot:135902-Rhodomonas_salina.2
MWFLVLDFGVYQSSADSMRRKRSRESRCLCLFPPSLFLIWCRHCGSFFRLNPQADPCSDKQARPPSALPHLPLPLALTQRAVWLQFKAICQKACDDMVRRFRDHLPGQTVIFLGAHRARCMIQLVLNKELWGTVCCEASRY